MRFARIARMPDNGMFLSSIANIAAAGTNQATATPVTSRLSIVTAADGTKGVVLPSAMKGMELFIMNTVAGQALKVYPAAGDSSQFNALGADAAFTIVGGMAAHFQAESKVQWRVADSSTQGVTPGTVTASKAVVVDSNKDVGTFRNLRATRLIHSEGAAASVNTAGAATYTAAQLVGGVIVRDPNGAGRTDTLDTAANLVAAVPGATVGDIIDVLIVNGADAAEAITLQAGAGGGFDANQTAASRVIAQNASKMVRIRLTNVTPASEAYVVYS